MRTKQVVLDELQRRSLFNRDTLIELAEEIFNYRPNFLLEQASCFLAPFLTLPLRMRLANVSPSLHYDDLVRKAHVRFNDDAFVAVDEMLGLGQWERNGCIRSVSPSSVGEGYFVLGSYLR